jgi:hypothetical protein
MNFTDLQNASLGSLPCVYLIACSASGRIYVGQTLGLRHRMLHEHMRALTANRHHNRLLQRTFNARGPENLELRVAWEMPFEHFELLGRRRATGVCEAMEAAVGYGLLDAGIALINGRDFARWGGPGNPVTMPGVRERISAKHKELRADAERHAAIVERTHSERANSLRREAMLTHWKSGAIRAKVVSTWDAKRGHPKVVKPALFRPVIRLDTGERFPTAKAGAESVGRCPSGITRAIKRNIACGDTKWAYATS